MSRTWKNAGFTCIVDFDCRKRCLGLWFRGCLFNCDGMFHRDGGRIGQVNNVRKLGSWVFVPVE